MSAPPVKLLAVDDRRENLVALEAAFRDVDYQLESAISGRAALKLASEHDFAAILLDVQMPGMDGFETAKLLRTMARSKHTPIIFMTAIHRTEQYERTGYISGAVDFLFKPLDLGILLAKVAVFVDLYRSKLEIQRQAEIIKAQALQEQELEFLKRSIEVRDDFLSIASHELNTPMTPLSLQMQTFLKYAREGRLHEMEPERLLRMLETSNGQVDRLARIISELLDISRITSGQVHLKEDEIGLCEVVKSVVEGYSEQISAMACEVRVECISKPRGRWDRTRIEQIVVNLLSNALKYGLGKPIEITVDTSGVFAILKVKDEGIGIAPEDQSRIFERFERAVSLKRHGGLGLGLYIVRELVQLHDGFVTVESAPGEGSTFTVELPLDGKRVAPYASAREPANARGSHSLS